MKNNMQEIQDIVIVGRVVGVSSNNIKIELIELQNQEVIYYNNKIFEMPKINQYIAIKHLNKKIVVQIESEELNLQLQKEHSEKIIRVLNCKLIGYFEDNKFKPGIKIVPVIYNEVILLNSDEIATIISNGKIEINNAINVGRLTTNELEYFLPINGLFNSHIAIFGNTGSGKSNTLVKLYTELFKNFEIENRKFIVIDFNGEYCENDVFLNDKEIYKLNTNSEIDIEKENSNKINLSQDDFYDVDILSMIYEATEKTQKPFLNQVLTNWKKNENNDKKLNNYIHWTFNEILTSDTGVTSEMYNLIKRVLNQLNESYKMKIEIPSEIKHHSKSGYFYNEKICNSSKSFSFKGTDTNFIYGHDFSNPINKFDELLLRCELFLLNSMFKNNDRYEHINPLINKIKSKNISLKKVIELENDFENNTSVLKIISLKNCNKEIQKLIPMLVATEEYKKQKKESSRDVTTHLIIDEAHNILSNQSISDSEIWKDYRLEKFEEIIKEGRKFGFFITICSQRPSDISSTIVSQVHNFLIHRLVNDNDLLKIKNCVSTLSSSQFNWIPNLSKGTCVVSGTAIELPQVIEVDYINEKESRPYSDDYSFDLKIKKG